MEFSGIMQEWVVLQRSKFRSLFLSSRKLQSYRSVQWGLYCRALSLHSAKVLKAEAAWQCHLCRLLLLGGLRAPRGVSTILPPRSFPHCLCAKRELVLYIPNFRAMQEWSVPRLDIWQTTAVIQRGKKKTQFLVIQPPDAAAVAAGWNLLQSLILTSYTLLQLGTLYVSWASGWGQTQGSQSFSAV